MAGEVVSDVAGAAVPTKLLEYGLSGSLVFFIITGLCLLIKTLWADNKSLRAQIVLAEKANAEELKALNGTILAMANSSVAAIGTQTATIKNLGEVIDGNTKSSDARLNAITGMATTLAVLVDRTDTLFEYTKDIFRRPGGA